MDEKKELKSTQNKRIKAYLLILFVVLIIYYSLFGLIVELAEILSFGSGILFIVISTIISLLIIGLPGNLALIFLLKEIYNKIRAKLRKPLATNTEFQLTWLFFAVGLLFLLPAFFDRPSTINLPSLLIPFFLMLLKSRRLEKLKRLIYLEFINKG